MKQQNSKMNKRAPMAAPIRRISPKIMTMIVLLTVMGMLWGRVLLKGKNAPAAANAQETKNATSAAEDSAAAAPIKIEPIKLPFVEGRNDTLSRDPFSASNWTAYDLNSGGGSQQQTTQTNEDPRKAELQKIKDRLALQAVVCDAEGKPLRAFINDKILTVGTSLTVKEGPDQYELTLTDLGKTEAVLKWHDNSITLKMAETFE